MPTSTPPHPTRRPSARRPAAPAALLAGALAAVGCGGDPLEAASRNNVDTIPATFVVYPISSAAAPLPTAVSVSGLTSVRPAIVTVPFGNTALLVPNFDFAVDRATDGRTRLLPSRLIAATEGTGRVLRTGFQVVNTPFDSLTMAPAGGYERDSATVVGARQTIVVETEPVTCLGNPRSFIYAKMVIDSVSPTSGGVYIRAVVDLNCGYRTVQVGVKPRS
jgi:hypothetical protein